MSCLFIITGLCDAAQRTAGENELYYNSVQCNTSTVCFAIRFSALVPYGWYGSFFTIQQTSNFTNLLKIHNKSPKECNKLLPKD